MPRVSAIARLPIHIRREVNNKLREAGFSGYAELSADLALHGFHISKSALHKYGQRVKRLARETAPDDYAYLMKVPDHSLPMTVVTVVDLQSGEARVFTTPNSISEVAVLLEPLRDVIGSTDSGR